MDCRRWRRRLDWCLKPNPRPRDRPQRESERAVRALPVGAILDHRERLVSVFQEQAAPPRVHQALHLAAFFQRSGEEFLDRFARQSAQQIKVSLAGGVRPFKGRGNVKEWLLAQALDGLSRVVLAEQHVGSWSQI